MDLNILLREESLNLMTDNQFISAWRALAKESHGFTAIQEDGLVVAWYEAYKAKYDPILVVAKDEKSQSIIGLIPLAMSKEDGTLSHAGHEQAEYNGWICKKEIEEEFLICSLVALKNKFNLKTWNWGWLPPHADVSWLKSPKLEEHGIYSNTVTFESPIYDLDDEERINKIKKSKSTKSKINRLKRTGELRFERITEFGKAQDAFKQVKKIANFRNLAVYDNMPFKDTDHSKEEWHLNHLKNADNVHFTVLWHGDELLACNFGFCSEDTVVIGLFTYNPVHGAHSPGNVFLIELIDYIKSEGYRYLDLSPGGDPYKERFSNAHNLLVRPIISFTTLSKIKNDSLTYVKNRIKEKYSYRDVMAIQATIKSRLNSIKSILKLSSNGDTELYKSVPKEQEKLNPQLNKQRYDDLLLYKSEDGDRSHTEIIFSALKNFERGDVLYTKTESGRLVFSAWLSESKKKHWDSKVHNIISSIENHSLIYDVF